MTLNPDRELSPQAVEALDGLMIDRPRSVEFTDRDLLDFLRGSLAEAERERLASVLLGSATGRKRLVALHRETASLFRSPVARWDATSRGALFIDPAREALQAARDLTATQWNRVVRSEERSFALLRATLATIAQNARIALSAPRLAAVRGESGSETVRLFVGVSEDGALTGQAIPSRPEQANRAATLSLVDPLGGDFPIASAEARDGLWDFRAEEFGMVTDLPEGPLPNSLFRVTFDDRVTPRDPGALWIDDDGGLLAVRLTRPPRVVGGVLTLALEAPASLAEAYATKRLVVSLQLGRHEVALGEWTVADAFGGEVSVPVFDLPEGELLWGSMLKARLTDGEDA